MQLLSEYQISSDAANVATQPRQVVKNLNIYVD
jgi:hypothetical protein